MNWANGAQTTIVGAITAGAIQLTVASAARFPAVPFHIVIDSELMNVTAIAGTTWTVTRGIESSTAIAHADSSLATCCFTAGDAASFLTNTGNISIAGDVTAYQFDSRPANLAATSGEIRLWCNDVNGMPVQFGFLAPPPLNAAAGVGVVWTLPAADGSPGWPLFTDGSSNLFFADPAGQFASIFAGLGATNNLFEASQAISLQDAVTNAAPVALFLSHDTSGTAAAGFGLTVRIQSQDSTTADTNIADVVATWVTATHASRKGQLAFKVYDTAARTCVIMQASGAAPMIGFLGAAAVIRQANASQAAITAVADANAKSALQALYNLLVAYGLAPATA